MNKLITSFKEWYLMEQQMILASKLVGKSRTEELEIHVKQMMTRLGCMGMDIDEIIEFMDSIAKKYDPRSF